MMNDIDISIQESVKEQKEIEKQWLELKENIKNKIATDSIGGISFLDSLIESKKRYTNYQKIELLLFSWEILYELEAYQLALEQCIKATKLSKLKDPLNMIYQAGSYTQLGNFDSAKKIIIEATEYSPQYNWLLGNLYEVIKEKELAIQQYEQLYKSDTIRFHFCVERIKEIESGTPLLLELDYSKIEEVPKLIIM